MKIDFYKKIIDTAAELEIPSVKLNWRGEPLLHPKLHKFIKYAKNKGILDVSINTNATNLNEKKTIELMNKGKNIVLYSYIRETFRLIQISTSPIQSILLSKTDFEY